MADAADEFLERYRTHPFQASLQQCKADAERLLADGAVQSEPQLTRVQRLVHGTEWAVGALQAVDGSMTAAGTLNELHGFCSSISSQLLQFTRTRNDVHLAAANDNLDGGVIPTINRLPKIESPADVHAVFSTLNAERSAARTLLKALDEELEATRERLARILQDEGRALEKISQLETRIDSVTQRTDEAITKFNERSTDAERHRDEAFTSTITALTRDVESYRSENTRELAAIKEQLTADASQIVSAMTRQRDEAAKLLNVIGDTSVSSPFDATATRDRKTASALRVWAGVCFGAMLLMFVAMAIKFVQENMAWEYMVFRFMTVIVFVIPALYFAREASKFQDEADRNRRLQLELASIGPFIEALPDERKAILREELSRRYFAAVGVQRELEKSLDPNILLELLKSAISKK